MDIGYNTVNTCMLWLWWMIIFYNIRPWHQLKCLYHFYNHPYSSTNDLNHMFLKRVTKIDLDLPPLPDFFLNEGFLRRHGKIIAPFWGGFGNVN